MFANIRNKHILNKFIRFVILITINLYLEINYIKIKLKTFISIKCRKILILKNEIILLF